MAVRQVFVEKKPGFDGEAARLREDLANFLGCPELTGLRRLRILNRYLVEGLDDGQFRRVTALVFSEPQCDHVFDDAPLEPGDCCFGVEYLPGQYDQRSDSAEQCAELAAGVRPRIRSGRLYILKPGDLPVSGGTLETVKRYLINPVDSREASLEVPPSLEDGESPVEEVPVLRGFTDDPEKPGGEWARSLGLAMSAEDLRFCRDYFASAGRDPSLAELRVLDTYWSDHCRHTTFTTMLEQFDIEDPAARRAWELYEAARREVYGPRTKRPRTLMDIATIGLRVLKKRGLAGRVEESAEINACTIRVEAEFGASVRADNSITDGEANGKANDSDTTEPWLLLFKNETHNHPTEIEPFGGAATCLGGAIRDPLSGRAYVYQAMRISGGADPRERLEHTLRGKLPQIKIAHDAAAGYSSYGNQIGLATGQVAEFYHSGFLAKRLELGAVIAAVPAAWVRREEPAPGDVVILVGGKTGRDGIGGATGSSKMHSGASVTSAGAEVQKGNAVEERKLQRLFRSSRAAALIKRCNDFGAGGVAVAAGELAAGLDINLDAVPKKYAGLNGVELAISESQERMAVVAAAADADEFIALAAAENLDAAVIAQVTVGNRVFPGSRSGAEQVVDTAARLRMFWRGKTIVDLNRKFLDSNGAPRSARLHIPPAETLPPPPVQGSPRALLEALELELSGLRSGSRRGLQERFDGSIGAASVLFPWGGAEQGTPECGMAALLPSLNKPSRTASLFCFGYDPDLLAQNPYLGAKGAVREALAKFACLGGDYREAYLSLQEYFERPESPETWGKPAQALLGALEAQLELGVPAIGGKDSMSGNYRDRELGIDITVPPTLAAFAAGTCAAESVRSGALAGPAGAPVILLAQGCGAAEGGSGDRGGPPFREARSISGAQDILRDITQTNKAFTNRARNITATISGNSIGKLGSEKAVRKSVSALVHTHAVANIDRLFEHAGIVVTHPDERGDTNINHIHRFGTVMEYAGEYYPVKMTVKEFEQNNDGTRIYSVEVLDIEEIKKSAGQLVPSLDKPGRDTPIADFSNSLLDLYRRVKGKARKKARGEPWGQTRDEAQDEWGIFRANMAALGELGRAGLVTAAYPVQSGGAAVSLALMAFGNNVGVEAHAASFPLAGGPDYQGSVLVQLRAEEEPDPAGPQTIRAAAPGSPKTISRRAAAILEKAGRWAVAAYTLDKPVFRIQAEPCFAAEAGHNMAGPGQNAASGKSDESGEAEVPLAVLRRAYESPLAQVYPQTSSGVTVAAENRGPTLVLPTARDTPEDKRQGGEYPAGRLRDKGFALKTRGGAPLAALPVFPGTNCEWDMERAFREAGAGTRLVIFRNRNREDIAASSRELAQAIAGAQILALSGGFSAGDEPDGSGKFIANALRSPAIAEEVTKLLERGGLVLGICNGFQALIKLGLVPYGKIMDAAETMPTLSFNRIGCHVSRMVRTRVMSTRSPWLALEEPGAIHILPVSHGEGRFVIRREEGEDLFRTGQAAFCYADAAGNPTLAEPDNPNGSDFAIEGLCSPDGRVLGKMAHSERRGDFVHINIPGNKRQRIFEAGVAYFR